MRSHHWLALLALLFLIGGFLAIAAMIVKLILWGIALILLISWATAASLRRRP